MRLAILAVGRLKSGPERELAEGYLTRIRGAGRKAGISAVSVSEFAESQAATAPARMAEEASLISAALPARAHAVILDARGKALTSQEFADYIGRHLAQGTPDFVFLIGGPDGHAPEMRTQTRAGLVLSLGPMTWPHRLVRVMLLEQIYRSVTIMLNHPYHRA